MNKIRKEFDEEVLKLIKTHIPETKGFILVAVTEDNSEIFGMSVSSSDLALAGAVLSDMAVNRSSRSGGLEELLQKLELVQDENEEETAVVN